MKNVNPDWLLKGIKTRPRPTHEQLKNARTELYDALALFQTHVRWQIGIMFSLMTTTIGIMIASARSTMPGIISLLKDTAFVIVLVTPILVFLSWRILRRYYEVYVSALLFALRLDLLADSGEQRHPWLKRTLEQTREWPVKSDLAFVKRRALSSGDSCVCYGCVILLLGIIVVAALIVFIRSDAWAWSNIN